MASIRRAATGTISRVFAAVFVDDPKALKAALDAGESVDARDGEERTALFQALVDGRTSLVKALLAAGADCNARDRRGETPLHVAARHHRVLEARLLVQSGARADAADENGNSPLHRAVFAQSGSEELVSLLLEHGADPDLANSSGVTPRSLAEQVAQPEVRRLFEVEMVRADGSIPRR